MGAAIGFSVHTGWAAAVVLEGPPPRLMAKMRIVLADETHDARFVYHAASERPAEAARLLRGAAKIARDRAAHALRDLAPGTTLALPPSKRALPELSVILGSHPLLHSAEGELYRTAVVDAALALGLRVVTPDPVVPPDLGKMTAPWGKDQKVAAALAWAAIAGGRGANSSAPTSPQ